MIKTEKKLQKPYLKDYNLLVEQDLWHVHYHILLIIFWKEFIKSNVNMDMIIEKLEKCEIECKDCQCYICKLQKWFNRKQMFMFISELPKHVWRILKKIDSLIHTHFLTMISIILFYCYEKCLPLWIHGWLGKV